MVMLLGTVLGQALELYREGYQSITISWLTSLPHANIELLFRDEGILKSYQIDYFGYDLSASLERLQTKLTEQEISFLLQFLQENRRNIYRLFHCSDCFLSSDTLMNIYLENMKGKNDLTLFDLLVGLFPSSVTLWKAAELRKRVYEESTNNGMIKSNPPQSFYYTKEYIDYVFNKGLKSFFHLLTKVDVKNNKKIFMPYLKRARGILIDNPDLLDAIYNLDKSPKNALLSNISDDPEAYSILKFIGLWKKYKTFEKVHESIYHQKFTYSLTGMDKLPLRYTLLLFFFEDLPEKFLQYRLKKSWACAWEIRRVFHKITPHFKNKEEALDRFYELYLFFYKTKGLRNRYTVIPGKLFKKTFSRKVLLTKAEFFEYADRMEEIGYRFEDRPLPDWYSEVKQYDQELQELIGRET